MTNMTRLSTIAILVLACLLAITPAFGQTALTQTTLAAAVSTTSQTNIRLTSVTGVTATSTVIFVDQEAMFVNSVSGTTVGVTRGYNGTQTGKHASTANVLIGPPTAFLTQVPIGSCTRSAIYVPTVTVGLGAFPPRISDCLGGQWVTSTLPFTANTALRVLGANSGGTAYTSLNTNGTTVVAGTLYCSEIDPPVSKLVTGIGIMFGTTAGGSDKHLVALLDSAGNVLANSALAGATNSTASTYINYAFTSPYYVIGGAQYYTCTQSNGTTDTIRMLVTGTQDTYLTTSKTGTFGTIPAITVPTTFTTAVGPYAYLY